MSEVLRLEEGIISPFGRENMSVLKRILFQSLCLFVWVGLALGAGEQDPAPAIEIENPNHQFEQVTEGDVVKHEFRVYNRGNAPLEIKKVKPG
jgi:hypothetical protein